MKIVAYQIDTVEVSSSSLLVPTIKIKDLRNLRKSFLFFCYHFATTILKLHPPNDTQPPDFSVSLNGHRHSMLLLDCCAPVVIGCI